MIREGEGENIPLFCAGTMKGIEARDPDVCEGEQSAPPIRADPFVLPSDQRRHLRLLAVDLKQNHEAFLVKLLNEMRVSAVLGEARGGGRT